MSERVHGEAAPVPVASAAESMATLVAWASALFYWAEVGHNERVRTYWDALHYVSTSLSVGYANLFPETELGKVIGAVVMMVGPSLSAQALAPPAPEAPPPTDPALLQRLDAILQELQKLNATVPSPAGRG